MGAERGRARFEGSYRKQSVIERKSDSRKRASAGSMKKSSWTTATEGDACTAVSERQRFIIYISWDLGCGL